MEILPVIDLRDGRCVRLTQGDYDRETVFDDDPAAVARRWVAEMEEIALTFEGLGLTPKILQGAADMFRLESDTPLGDLTSRDPLPELGDMLDVLAKRATEG